MSSFRRLGLSQLRHWRPRAGSDSKGFFTEGTQDKMPGVLFNESPPPPGTKRQLESWEIPWYTAIGATALLLGIGLPARPDSSQVSWAHKQALKELKAEGRI